LVLGQSSTACAALGAIGTKPPTADEIEESNNEYVAEKFGTDYSPSMPENYARPQEPEIDTHGVKIGAAPKDSLLRSVVNSYMETQGFIATIDGLGYWADGFLRRNHGDFYEGATGRYYNKREASILGFKTFVDFALGVMGNAAAKMSSIGAMGNKLKPGEFNIPSWEGYPEGVPKPEGPAKLISGTDYTAARTAANKANQALHAADPSLSGLQIHEIMPVKFNGSPTDPSNKVPLAPDLHAVVTAWWNSLMQSMQ
jgi:hypothetical protein